MASFEGKILCAEYLRQDQRGREDGDACLWTAGHGAVMPASLTRTQVLEMADDLVALAALMRKRSEKRWIGIVPDACDVSKQPITDSFVDGRIKVGGRWAMMHPDVHAWAGVGLGEGRGQLYVKREGAWYKIE